MLARKCYVQIRDIKELHAVLLRSQDSTEGVDSQGRHVQMPLVRGNWKMQENYPVRNGVRYTYCPPEQTASEMDRLVDIHASQVERKIPSEVRAAWLHHRFTQIHPFQDGNGRIARALASLVLVKDGLFPLVVTRDDKTEYIAALEAADGGDLKPLVGLIADLQITQFRKATAIAETLLAEEGVQEVLEGLQTAADRIAADKLAELRGVFDLAHKIERDLVQRLEAIRPDIIRALRRVDHRADAKVHQSNKETDYYFRAQILENAKFHLDYFANMGEYRSWAELGMYWTRRAKLVFAIHGFGKPFNGSLVCAPFLEFLDTDEENQTRISFRPVAEEGFVLFYNEDPDRMLARFTPWRENVLKIAIKELTANL